MTPFKRLSVLFTALTLLFSLPALGAEAGASSSKSPKSKAAQKRAAAKQHRKHKRRKHAKKHKSAAKKRPQAKHQPAAEDDDVATPIGTVSAIDGEMLTVTLTAGGSMTARFTYDTAVTCPDDDSADDEDDDSSADDDGDDDSSDDEDGDDDFDGRWTQLADGSCAPAVGDAVYEAEIEDGVYTDLDLAGA